MKLTKNILNNQNYILWEREYSKMFDYAFIHLKELNSAIWPYLETIYIGVFAFIIYLWTKFEDKSVFFFGLLLFLIWVVIIYTIYKIIVTKHYRKNYIVYKIHPMNLSKIIIKGIQKTLWSDYVSQKFFRDKYFVVIKK